MRSCNTAAARSYARAGSEQTTCLISLNFVGICKPLHSHLLIRLHNSCHTAVCQVLTAASTRIELQGISALFKKGVRLLYSDDGKKTGKDVSKVMSQIPLMLLKHWVLNC